MAELKRAYLFTGDDEVKIDQARKRLAARAEADGASVESLAGDSLTAEAFAMTLTSPSLLPGTRIVLADGIERWKAADVGPAADALALLADGSIDAVAVMICRKKPLKAITDAVAAVGGQVQEFKPPGDAELPGWLVQEATRLGVTLAPKAAELMISIVGKPDKRVSAAKNWSPKRRLMSELEKLATAVGPGGSIDAALVGELVKGETTAEVFALTDHALSGDRDAAIRDAGILLASGQAPPMIVALLARSFGQAQSVAALHEAGRGGEVTEQLGIQPWLAKKLAAQARARGGSSLRAAMVEIARLDDAVKGGTALDDETELLRSISVIAGR